MRWLLPILFLLALFAPRQECPTRGLMEYRTPPGSVAPPQVMEVDGVQMLLPPLRVGHPVARLGTDSMGRDSACLLGRGLRRSILLALGVLALGFLPGLLLGLWTGWHGRVLSAPNESITLLIVILLLGASSFRAALVLGTLLLTARLVATQVDALRREPFIEGAVALGATTVGVLRRHIVPFLLPTVPFMFATVLSGIFLWMMEFGALGFYDQGVLRLSIGDALDPVQNNVELPVQADLGQLISSGRWAWLTTPELLALPATLLALLTLCFKDMARWSYAKSQKSGVVEG